MFSFTFYVLTQQHSQPDAHGYNQSMEKGGNGVDRVSETKPWDDGARDQASSATTAANACAGLAA